MVIYRNNQTSAQSHTGVAMIPAPVAASTNTYQNAAFDGASGETNPTNNPKNAHNQFVQPSAPAAAAVGEHNDYEPSPMYESVPNTSGSQAPASYDIMRPNRLRIINNIRNSLMPR